MNSILSTRLLHNSYLNIGCQYSTFLFLFIEVNIGESFAVVRGKQTSGCHLHAEIPLQKCSNVFVKNKM